MQLNLLLTRLYKFLAKNKKRFVFIPLGIYWVILLVLTSIPSEGTPTFGIGDKFEHLIAYFVLSILLQLTFHFQNKYKILNVRHAFYTLVIACFYGIFDEIHQYFIPGRYFDLLDLLANFIGIVIAVSLTSYFIKINSQSRDSKS